MCWRYPGRGYRTQDPIEDQTQVITHHAQLSSSFPFSVHVRGLLSSDKHWILHSLQPERSWNLICINGWKSPKWRLLFSFKTLTLLLTTFIGKKWKTDWGDQKSPPNKPWVQGKGQSRGPLTGNLLSLITADVRVIGNVTVVSHHNVKRSYCHLANRKWAQRGQSQTASWVVTESGLNSGLLS